MVDVFTSLLKLDHHCQHTEISMLAASLATNLPYTSPDILEVIYVKG